MLSGHECINAVIVVQIRLKYSDMASAGGYTDANDSSVYCVV